MSVLIVDDATKRYGSHEVVHKVSLKIAPGERVALLGHNGAGKTTLIRMILGLTPLSGGTIEVNGAAPGSRAARALIGFLPENVAFHGALTGREQLRHFAALKSLPSRQADELLEKVGLVAAADRKISTYSKGMRQRIGLAQAILGKPSLALLDEPTSGLDPLSRHEFYDIVQALSDQGTAVLLSSHALTELETRTDRIAILSRGRLVADDDLASLRKKAALPVSIRLTTAAEQADRVAEKLGGQRINGQVVRLTCLPENKVETLGRVSQLQSLIDDIDIAPASLEELYRHYLVKETEAS